MKIRRILKRGGALLTALLLALSAACFSPDTNPESPAPEETPAESTAAATTDPSDFTAKGKQTTDYFGTVSMLRIFDDFSLPESGKRLEAAWAEIKEMLEEVESALSGTVDNSDVARFNALGYGESIPVSGHTARVIELARELYELTGGLYDPTVYRLVDLWGFTPRFRELDYEPTQPYDRPREASGFDLPEQKYIDAFLSLIGMDGVVLSGDAESGYELTKLISPVTVDGVEFNSGLDLGGIGKGYVCDLAREILLRHGYEYGFFSCGGSSMALLRGMSDDGEGGRGVFELGMRKPRPGESDETGYVTIKTRNTSLSTSGDYDHAYIQSGTQYCHIIDTRTGYPVNMPVDGVQSGIATATVLGDGAAWCEGLSTALCAMTVDEAVEFLNGGHDGLKVVLAVYSSNKTYYEIITNMHPEGYEITDPAYFPASIWTSQGLVEYSGSIAR